MDKLEVQQRVSQFGEPLPLSKFDWDEYTNAFSSEECNLVLDFSDVDFCNFKTGADCTLYTGADCVFHTGANCTFKTSHNCNFETGSYCTFNTLFKCTFKTNDYCTFITGSNSKFKTGSYCTFNTGDRCIFVTKNECNFYTGSVCDFDTGYLCVFSVSYYCTFCTGINCVITRRDIFEVIKPPTGTRIQICPFYDMGYLVEIGDKFYLNGDESLGEHIIIDGMLSKVLSRKGDVLKVSNYGEELFVIKKGDIYSHGSTIKEAKESLIYKIGKRDKSAYDKFTLENVLSKEEAIKMYRVITGACEAGTRHFIENLTTVKDEYSVNEIIELTKGQYGNEQLVEFFK